MIRYRSSRPPETELRQATNRIEKIGGLDLKLFVLVPLDHGLNDDGNDNSLGVVTLDDIQNGARNRASPPNGETATNRILQSVPRYSDFADRQRKFGLFERLAVNH